MSTAQVWREAPIDYGTAVRKKERYQAGVVTPASPTLIDDAVNQLEEVDFAAGRPVLGLAATAR
eukprot:477367-Prorocentrum_minimum.AAC.1